MTRDEQIFEWLHGKWWKSAKGALWKHIGDYHVAVFRNRDRPDVWHLIFKLKTSKSDGFQTGEYFSPEAAKCAVLNKVANAMKCNATRGQCSVAPGPVPMTPGATTHHHAPERP
jgi:hypothetical protein